MNGNLLDTNVAVFAIANSKALSPAIKKAIQTGPNFLSVVSYWEVVLKSMKGKLDVGDPRSWWIEAQDQLVAAPVSLRPEHVTRLQGLTQIHKDHFDRILIATAMSENFTFLSTDRTIRLYASAQFRVVN